MKKLGDPKRQVQQAAREELGLSNAFSSGSSSIVLSKVAVIHMVLGSISLVGMFTFLTCHALGTGFGENKDQHSFTVQDAIEISFVIDGTEETRIEDRGGFPPGQPTMAPDKRHFFLITQRGVLATNKLEATLWVFDYQAVMDFVSKKSSVKPIPKQVAKLSATSNTPVISDARWLEDSNRIAFLGKNNNPYQQLFIANVKKRVVIEMTKSNTYVTSYDIRGQTIAYTTLNQEVESPLTNFVDVTGKTINSLLYAKNPGRIEDFTGSWKKTIPSILHVEKNGKELTVPFLLNGKPLNLFAPTLSLSPDGQSLITLAPIREIPPHWDQYEPGRGAEFLRLRAGNKFALAIENPWKLSEYIKVDIRTGLASPLLDAPAGRSLIFGAPSRAFWFKDGRRAVLSSTFLPLCFADLPGKETDSQHAVVTVVDTYSGKVQPVRYFDKNIQITDVAFAAAKNEVVVRYVGTGGREERLKVETYQLESGKWVEAATTAEPSSERLNNQVEIAIYEDFNHPPVLSGHLADSAETKVIWDPNPQMEGIKLGKTSIYHWRDKNGNSWAGILALPPDYDPERRYPLVIQTYGYDAKRFFVDGAFTTGYGGRALASKGIVVLQSDEAETHMDTPEEGPDQIAIFEAAVEQLSADGLVDPRRVGVIGFSRTCFHVLYAITHRPDLFAAAAITDGLNFSYLQYVLSTDLSNFQDVSERVNESAPFGEGLKNWASNAPGFNLDKVKAPLLISALEKGELIYEWEIYSGLRRLGKPVDMLWWWKENTPHLLVQPAQRYASQQAATDWFDFWLTRHEDPDATKVEQYVRWHEIRKLQENYKISRQAPN